MPDATTGSLSSSSQHNCGVGDGQGSLACCSPWGRKELERLSDWTELNWNIKKCGVPYVYILDVLCVYVCICVCIYIHTLNLSSSLLIAYTFFNKVQILSNVDLPFLAFYQGDFLKNHLKHDSCQVPRPIFSPHLPGTRFLWDIF